MSIISLNVDTVKQQYTTMPEVMFTPENSPRGVAKSANYDTMLKYVNRYSANGIVCFPLENGKTTNRTGWNKLKTTRINSFADKNLFSYAILTGEASGITVVDVDTCNDVISTHWTKIVDTFDEDNIFSSGSWFIPTHNTPSGGVHYIFAYHPDKNQSRRH